MVAELYKNRWQIGLFFKWLKQHLKIMKFGGTTENAVRIQIYVAISTYLWFQSSANMGRFLFGSWQIYGRLVCVLEDVKNASE